MHGTAVVLPRLAAVDCCRDKRRSAAQILFVLAACRRLASQHARSFRRSAASRGRAGLGVGQESAVPTVDPPLSGPHETPSRKFEISNSRTISKMTLPPPSALPPHMLFWSRKSASLQGATDWRTPAGIQVLLMASVGEPINRPRHTRQRDRSQTVLAAPRDTRGRALSSPARGALRGSPRAAATIFRRIGLRSGCAWEKWGREYVKKSGSATSGALGSPLGFTALHSPRLAVPAFFHIFLPPIRSPSCLRNKGLSLKRIGWLYPIFRPPHRL